MNPVLTAKGGICPPFLNPCTEEKIRERTDHIL